MVLSVEAVDMGRLLSGTVVSDVAEAFVEFDNKDVLLPKANEEPEADDSDEHSEEPENDAEDTDEDDKDDSEDGEEPIFKLFGDFGELLRIKNFAIGFDFDFGSWCCCCKLLELLEVLE